VLGGKVDMSDNGWTKDVISLELTWFIWPHLAKAK